MVSSLPMVGQCHIPINEFSPSTTSTNINDNLNDETTIDDSINNINIESSITEDIDKSIKPNKPSSAPSSTTLTQNHRRRRCPIIYDNNKEALGWAVTSMPRGITIMGGAVFMSVALLDLAKKAAGCDPSSTKECTGRVYGMKPSSLLTMIMLVVGILSATMMPAIGAIIDHTNYRRAVGRFTALIMCGMIFGQMFISEENWFVMVILQVLVAFFYCVHSLAIFAYMPELTNDKQKLTKWTASFTAIQYIAMLVFLIVMVAITSSMEADNIEAARLSQTIVFGTCVIFIGTAWTFLFKKRKASQKVPEGSYIITAGFRKLGRTISTIFSRNPSLRWFLIAVSFTESAVSSFNTVAVTYMTDRLQLNATQNGIAILVLLLCSIPGSQISTIVTNQWNPIRSYQVALSIWIVTTCVALVVLDGPGKEIETYILSSGWGIATGWVYPTERVAYCQMIKKGEEAELMGVYLCFCSVLNWLPPLVFTALNEAGVDMRISFASIILFFFTSFCLLFLVGNFQDIVNRVRREEAEASSHGPIELIDLEPSNDDFRAEKIIDTPINDNK